MNTSSEAFIYFVKQHQDSLLKTRSDDFAEETVVNAGFQRIGCGSYARVWEHPDFPGCVVKVNHGSDRGYSLFLDAIKYYGECEHFPKIYYTQEYPCGSRITLLEALVSFDCFRSTVKTDCCNSFLMSSMRGEVNNRAQKTSSFLDAVILLGLYSEKVGITPCCDLHDSNFMARLADDGSHIPVVTDPWA